MWMIFHKPSPVGMLTLSSDGAALTGLWLDGQKYFGVGLSDTVKENDLPVFEQASAWLDAYFAKAPLPALPPLAPQGSPFRQAVWRLLLEIPYGTVTTYGALARTLRGQGISAAGGAVGHNPISILIPCHRVVGSDGSLTGYAGGVANKQFLLELEGVDMTGLCPHSWHGAVRRRWSPWRTHEKRCFTRRRRSTAMGRRSLRFRQLRIGPGAIPVPAVGRSPSRSRRRRRWLTSARYAGGRTTCSFPPTTSPATKIMG